MRSRRPLLLLATLLAACGGGGASGPSAEPGLELASQAPASGVVPVACEFNRCQEAALALGVRATAGAAASAATVRVRLLGAGGAECAFAFAARRDLPAGQPVSFDLPRVVVTPALPGRELCPLPFNTANAELALLDGDDQVLLTRTVPLAYTFAR